MRKSIIKDNKKYCPKCRSWVHVTDYHKSSSSSTGLASYCKECTRQVMVSDKRAMWVKKNSIKNKDKISDYRRKYKLKMRNAVLDKFGRICKHCGFSDVRALQVDHVFGDGFIDRKLYSGPNYKRVIEDVDGKYQLLCANCNWIKRFDNSEIAWRDRKIKELD